MPSQLGSEAHDLGSEAHDLGSEAHDLGSEGLDLGLEFRDAIFENLVSCLKAQGAVALAEDFVAERLGVVAVNGIVRIVGHGLTLWAR